MSCSANSGVAYQGAAEKKEHTCFGVPALAVVRCPRGDLSSGGGGPLAEYTAVAEAQSEGYNCKPKTPKPEPTPKRPNLKCQTPRPINPNHSNKTGSKPEAVGTGHLADC